ncbi:hypothetical protein EVAR_103762_1 [Eumeta japonica]|uniref:Uncharacterized protein n=1 Tax=Eumeta variegata TaxID=151549 RepID=A0A4C2AAK2_EUMVA|nr:hypothetical protein EVAR_103762_1 [Eumeta japonica]
MLNRSALQCVSLLRPVLDTRGRPVPSFIICIRVVAMPRAREPAGREPRASGEWKLDNSVDRESCFNNEMTQL